MEYLQTGASRYVGYHRHLRPTRQDGDLGQRMMDLHVCMAACKPDFFDTPVVTTTGSSAIHVLGQELDTSLVQGQSMSEIADMFAGSRCARQRLAPTQANRRYSVPGDIKAGGQWENEICDKDSP